MKQILKTWSIFTIALCSLAYAAGSIVGYLELPVVYKSYSTGKVVKVETKDGPGDINNLPTKYHLTWIK